VAAGPSIKQPSKGFTLIELMVVIAIIGILASLTIAAYQTYIVRSQVAEGIAFASGAKVPIIDAYTNDRVLPASRVEAGMTPDPADSVGSYVTRLDIVNGRIDVTFGNRAHPDIAAQSLSLTPYLSDDSRVLWRCGNAPQPPGIELVDHRAPTVDPRYLPASCR
jgi:type IV pilus assembly protein PilA